MSHIIRYRISPAHLLAEQAYSATYQGRQHELATEVNPAYPLLAIGSGDTPEDAYQSAVGQIDGMEDAQGEHFAYSKLPKAGPKRIVGKNELLSPEEAVATQYFVLIRFALSGGDETEKSYTVKVRLTGGRWSRFAWRIAKEKVEDALAHLRKTLGPHETKVLEIKGPVLERPTWY
jgi:hypothetical protein